MIEKLHIYITVLAALVVNICCLAASIPLYNASVYLVVTIVVFYIIGRFVRSFFIKNFVPDETKNNASENDDEALETSEADGIEISEEQNNNSVKN